MTRADLRIFAAHDLHGRGPRREHQQPDLAVVPRPAVALDDADAQLARDIVRILEALPGAGESVQGAFDRKERELRRLFDDLSLSQRKALRARVAESAPGDVVIAALARLTPERRHRVVSTLSISDARRGGAR